jgi:uncharacterized protein YacL
MKNFIKICLITLAIQLGGIVVGLLVSNLCSASDLLKRLGTTSVLISVLVSIMVDIILAIRWGTNIKKKLIYIFLMPTNYLWIVYVIWAFWYIGQWIDMIMNISK